MTKLPRARLLRTGLALTTAVAAIGVTASAAEAAAFTPGDLVVEQLGAVGNSATLTSAGTPVVLDEYSPAGALIQQLPLPTAPAGANNPLVESGSAGSDGGLSLSANGQCVVTGGYDASTGTTGVASSTVNRDVAVVSPTATIDTSTAVPFASAVNIRSVTSDNCANLWLGGQSESSGTAVSGVGYTTLGSSTVTAISANSLNARQVAIADGQLYVDTGSNATLGVAPVGTGLPTSAASDGTPISTSADPSPYAFQFLTLGTGSGNAGAGPNTLYTADSGGAVYKFSLVGGTWTPEGSISVKSNISGLTATTNGSSVTLYITYQGSSSAGGTLYSLTDASGFGKTITGTPTAIAQGSADTNFRGVAFVPETQSQLQAADISEWRPYGPKGAVNDDYVSVANTSSSALSVAGWSLSFVNASGTVEGVPLTGSIPVNGHLLAGDSAYSLTTAADVKYALPSGFTPVGVQLLNPNGTVVDAAGEKVAPPAGTVSDFSEPLGTTTSGSPAPTSTPTGQFSYTRNFSAGLPVNTQNNSSDFSLLAVDGSGGSTIGTPGAQDLASPVFHNDILQSSLIDPAQSANAAPNFSFNPGTGIVDINRQLTNCAGQATTGPCVNAPANTASATVTRLQFRVTGLTTGVLLAVTSPGGTVTGPNGSDTVLPLTLASPAASSGGGVDSVLTAALPTGGIPAGSSVDVEFQFHAVGTGAYTFAYNAEDDLDPDSAAALSDSSDPAATPSGAGAGLSPTVDASSPTAASTPAGDAAPVAPSTSGSIGATSGSAAVTPAATPDAPVTRVVKKVTKKHVVKKKAAKHKVAKKHAVHKTAKKHAVAKPTVHPRTHTKTHHAA